VIRRLPLVPTLIVAAAIAVMIALGVWQIGRAKEKDSLLAQYRAAEGLPPIAFPATPLSDDQLPLFRHATAMCLQPVAKRATAGRNRAGEPGYVHIVDCRTGFEGPGVSVELGWSRDPRAKVNWRGGPVSGVIAPDRRSRMRLVAASAPEGLAPSAPPSLETIPNNHRSYAVQWFLFAFIAAAIYALAVRKRLKPEAPAQ
jgi:cytochrome oxidase assembly protein ShyY1